PMLAPAFVYIGGRDSGDVAGLAVFHGQTVQMAAVFRGEPRDEWGLPDRPEAVGFTRGGEAAKEGIHEDRAMLGIERDIVNIDVAGGVGALRHVEAIEAVGDLSRWDGVLKSPELPK